MNECTYNTVKRRLCQDRRISGYDQIVGSEPRKL